MKKLGDDIREARKSMGWNQTELAKKAKLSQQTISFAEKGYLNISVRTLKSVTDALGLRILISR
jgi:transcriptional regulator with XRE-family HTH domain